MKRINTSVFVASHISDLSGPTEALLKYLRKNSAGFTAVLNPLEYCTIAKRQIITRHGGKEDTVYPGNLLQPALLSWIIDFVLVFIRAVITPGKIGIFIGCDPLNAFAGTILLKLGKVQSLVFYTVDWSEKRFSNAIINNIYYKLDLYCAKSCSLNWCVSESLITLRKSQNIDGKKLVLMPIGIDRTQIKSDKPKNNKFSLVFLGALERTKGIDLVLDSWPELFIHNHGLRLFIIGKTPNGTTKEPYEDRFRKLKGVTVIGLLSKEKVLQTIPKYGIGLAPYSNDTDSVTRYADPSRIKDYLSCGLPVITTEVPPVHLLIESERAGLVIEYTKDSLLRAIDKILANYNLYRRNAFKLAAKYQWPAIFDHGFSKISLG